MELGELVERLNLLNLNFEKELGIVHLSLSC